MTPVAFPRLRHRRRAGASVGLVSQSAIADETLLGHGIEARHRFGTLVTSKHSIARAADLMGHGDVSTTKRYDHADGDDLRDIQNSV